MGCRRVPTASPTPSDTRCSTSTPSRRSRSRQPGGPSPSSQARPAPSGVLPVVLKSGSGGILFHEACGHGLEADHILKDSSAYTGRVGQMVASPGVTLVDDGTLGPNWGTLVIDDEGRPTQRNVLIRDGVLTDYMWDYLRARKEGRTSSGNGRRQSYQDLPMVRMTNTFLLAGKEDPDEIVSQTPNGVYVAQLGGGQVNTATGDFVFGMTEAYLIENGRITEPLRNANLIGNGPDVLSKIDAIGNDFDMSPGTCGKDGQSVSVGCGQPTPARDGHNDRRYRECLISSTWHAGVLEQATTGEEVEVYVSHGRETSVRVFEGAIEQLETAESAGVGVRVISGGRQGFSYVGALDESAAKEALIEARDNARFATVDEHAGLASPDGVEPPLLDLWREELVSFPTDDRVALALELERRVRAGDSRIRQVVSSDYVDGFGETAIATSRGIEVTDRQTGCYLFVHAVAGDGDDTQTGIRLLGGPCP